MAEAVVSFVLETIGNLLNEEGRFLLGVTDQVNRLNAELKRMLSFLKEADAKQNESPMVREWVSQTRDLAYQAEYLVERYAFGANSRKGKGVKNIIRRGACFLDEVITRHRDGSDIESLTTNISELRRSFHEYGVRSIMQNESGSNSRQLLLRRSHSHVIEEDLVGVDSQVEMLAKNLVSGDYALVSIFGMGGLGKTTLARKLYHHPDVRRSFDLFSWICISQKWQKRDLLEGIITKFMPESGELIKQWRDEELFRKLNEFQRTKKCLVVLDDIWSSDAWDSIKDAFLIGVKGSKVLLTTRNEKVATHVGASGVTIFPYQPRLLSNEESWELIKRKPLRQSHIQGCDDFHKMEELGKDMVSHCGGLPLAVLVLGGILATKQRMVIDMFLLDED